MSAFDPPRPVNPANVVRLRSVPLGGSSLSRAIQARRVPVEWRVTPPADRAAWRTHLEAVRASATDWLPRLRPAFGEIAHAGARQRLADAAARGVLVTTGQQPGLFGGPAYTLTKALSALALADELQATFGLPVAPVFWAATDDADWREASVTHVVGRDGLLALAMAGPPTDGVPMAEVPLGDVSVQREALRAACGSVADPLVLDLVDAAYVEGTTVGGAYVRWLRSVLEPLGVVVLDASHAALRASLDPHARAALRAASTIDAAVRARTEAVIAAGYTPQVELVDGLSLVFASHAEAPGHGRARVPIDAAAEQAMSVPVGALGANVLLRPVLERAVLPTVAYVAGPGELAYFAQATAVAESLGTPVPVAVPRWSADWQEPQVERLMQRLGVTDEELADPYRPETRLARAALDRDVTDAVERLRVTLDAQVAALGRAVADADALVPAAVVDGLARDLGHRLDRVERRLVAAVKRRQVDITRDLAVARAARHPMGASPERVLSLVPTLARHGLGVLSVMRDAAAGHARALIAGTAGDASSAA